MLISQRSNMRGAGQRSRSPSKYRHNQKRRKNRSSSRRRGSKSCSSDSSDESTPRREPKNVAKPRKKRRLGEDKSNGKHARAHSYLGGERRSRSVSSSMSDGSSCSSSSGSHSDIGSDDDRKISRKDDARQHRRRRRTRTSSVSGGGGRVGNEDELSCEGELYRSEDSNEVTRTYGKRSTKKERRRKDDGSKRKRLKRKDSSLPSTNSTEGSAKKRSEKKRKTDHKQKKKRRSREKRDYSSSIGTACTGAAWPDRKTAKTLVKQSPSSKGERDMLAVQEQEESEEVALKAAKARAMVPMRPEEHEAQQSTVREVFDEDTGRWRLVKGTGEIIERIVSREQQQEIQQHASRWGWDHKVLSQTKSSPPATPPLLSGRSSAWTRGTDDARGR